MTRKAWFTKTCPKCGKRAVITKESRPTQQWRRRIRTCVQCGERGVTLEVEVEPGMRAMITEVRARGGFQLMVRDMPMVLVAEKFRVKQAS